MSVSKEEIVNDFNTLLLSLASNLAAVCPRSVIGANIGDVEKTIKNRANFYKFIDMFCIKVLPYRPQIDAGDETFFLKKDYEGDIKDVSEVSLNNIITLKSVWEELKHDNKNIVFMNMQYLCELASQYVRLVRAQLNL